MEMAQRQNQKLLAAYQARIARSGTAKQQQATLVRNDHSQIIFRSTYILPAAYTRNILQGSCFHEPEKDERITQ